MRTIFLDTSALVKIYAYEPPGSTEVRRLFKSATLREPTVTLVVCDVAWAEAASALSRKGVDREITRSEADRYLERLTGHFEADARPYLVIQSSSIMRDVPAVARQHHLKGLDAIQLTAALAARYLAQPGTDFYFACTDGKLCRAARAEHFQMIELPEGGAGQSAVVGSPLAQPLTVQVEDQNGEPFPGATVRWRVTAGGGSVAPSSSTSGSDGIAEAVWTLGSEPGTQEAIGYVEGVDTVAFTATAAPPFSVLLNGTMDSFTLDPETNESRCDYTFTAQATGGATGEYAEWLDGELQSG